MWLTVHFIDVGQGDAIWIHTADDSIDGNGIFEGKNIVIDGGPHSSSSDNPLRQYLETEAHAPAGLYQHANLHLPRSPVAPRHMSLI
jgi:hypothetical protein